MRPKRCQSASVETRPPAPDGKIGGSVQRPSAIGAKSGPRYGGSRSSFSKGTWKPVSVIPSGAKMPLGEELRQRLPRDARDQHALDVGAAVIEPRLAGLAEHRHLGERREPFVRRFSRPEYRELLE